MNRLYAWAQQPTSVAGFAAVFGTLSAVFSHQISWAQAGPLLSGAIVSIALPDCAGAKVGAQAQADATMPASGNEKDGK